MKREERAKKAGKPIVVTVAEQREKVMDPPNSAGRKRTLLKKDAPPLPLEEVLRFAVDAPGAPPPAPASIPAEVAAVVPAPPPSAPPTTVAPPPAPPADAGTSRPPPPPAPGSLY